MESDSETTEAKEIDPVELETHDVELARVKHERGLVARLQAESPETWQALLKNRIDILQRVRRACITTTVPEDWTLFRGPDDEVVGVPRKSGCASMRKLMGVTVRNYRPKNAAGDAEPAVDYEDVEADEKKKQPAHRVTVVTMVADGYCHFTGETIDDVRHAVRSDESFTGRGTVQDLAQSCRTGLDSKITRLLADVVKVPADVLEAHGVDTTRCYKGAGFGTSKDRGARGVADDGITEAAGKLGRDVLSRTGGDKEAARKLLLDITKNEAKDFKGFDSVDRITKDWQLELAWKNLKAHPVFGDEGRASK